MGGAAWGAGFESRRRNTTQLSTVGRPLGAGRTHQHDRTGEKVSQLVTQRAVATMSRRGYFGLALWHTKTPVNLGTAVRSAYAFGAAFVATVGNRYHKQASDTTAAWRHMPVFHYLDMDALVSGLPISCPLVAVELCEGASDLPGFQHPERAVYLLGPEDGSLSMDVLSRCHRRLKIPGASWCLNVSVAASIVLYDRVAKHLKGGGVERRPLYFIDPADGKREVA